MPPLLEVCVGDPESLSAAIEGGADRIELCSTLELGGLTPPPGLLALAARAPVPVYAMIRPRGGDFVFSAAERAAMLADIAAVRAAGLAGVVLGASLSDGSLDADALGELAGASRGLGTTLHRAFDLVPDIDAAIETAVALGFERILTSGRAPRAIDGVADLRRAQDAAAGRIGIMAGSGLGPDTVAALLAAVPLAEVHGTCSRAAGVLNPRAAAFGFATAPPRRTSADEVRRMKAALRAAS
ncbi:copper homeostasis protein CutC [Antarcticirhabdus aurantiaca]|uniref:Copper homeostasis protein CutC n=1 Tax=Antarcticirhabdus aurantiaca TaxID=2606717 RepID=A0ACD4NHN5_9HYPH|nr:copper homeostasis protein CutC [Antarcticirhabdus aurantiaca]WAJ26303.1 copper homeostasis protein CutC [Jeongeuplla avenae]